MPVSPERHADGGPGVSGQTCDVAVVGGGLVGTALAYELVAHGADVVLVDGHHPGRATDAGAGILSPETTWNPDEAWFSFGVAAAAHYRTLVSRLASHGAQETGFAECGLLLVAADPAEDDWFATRADLALGRSPGIVTEVTPTGGRRPLPAPRDGPARPAQSGGGPGRRAVDERGGARRSRSPRPAPVRGDRHGSAPGRGARRRVSCPTPEPCRAAPWPSPAGRGPRPSAEQLAVPIPVEPVKGQIVHLQLPAAGGGVLDSGSWPIVSPVLNHYLVAWPGGRVACGGTYEPGARFDARPTVAGLEELLRSCLAIAPGLAEAAVVDVRVGLRPVSGDDLPVLGPVPGWDNVHLVTGHGTEGLLLGPFSAALVARWVLGGPVPDELRPFSVGRFAP